MSRHYKLEPVFVGGRVIIPFEGDDGASEPKMAAIEGITLAALRARRRKGAGSPHVKIGKKIKYSKILRLLQLQREMREPLRKGA